MHARALWMTYLGSAVLNLCVLGCGSLDPAAQDPGELEQGLLLPLATGNRWTFRVTKDGVVSAKVTTVGNWEAVGGSGPFRETQAFRIVTAKGESDETVSWQAPLGEAVVRYREQAFAATGGALELEEHWSPPKLRVDGSAEHMAPGASWLESYEETKLPVGGAASTATARDRWTVLSASEEVTVPAGTFQALVLQRAGGSSAKSYWFVPGVGKVKETGGQTEELVSYELATP